MELLKINQDGEVLGLAQSIEDELVELDEIISSMKHRQDEIKKELLVQMRENGIVKMATKDITVSYIAPTERESFNAKAFREDNPDLYDCYVDIKPVKDSVRITVKK